MRRFVHLSACGTPRAKQSVPFVWRMMVAMVCVVVACSGGNAWAQEESRRSAEGDAGARRSAEGDAGVRRSAEGDAGARRSAEGDAGARRSAEGDAGVRRSAEGDAGVRRSAEGDAGARRSAEGTRGGRESGTAGAEIVRGFQPQTDREAALLQMIQQLQRELASLRQQIQQSGGAARPRGESEREQAAARGTRDGAAPARGLFVPHYWFWR